MIVPIIPLFLAANIAVLEGDWKYGPEVIYNVQLDAIARPQDSPLMQTASTNATLKLKCRLKDRLVLNCHFEESRHVVTLLKPGRSQVIKDNDDFGQNGPGEDVFELYFCPEGITSVGVSSSIHPAKLDMLRALVGQLNIGADLSNVTMNTFKVMDRSAAGVCETICDSSVKAVDENDARQVPDNSYKLVNIHPALYPNLELKELRKTRNLDRCLYRPNYFYGSYEGRRDPPSVAEITIKSSRSQMTITKDTFISYIENVVTITDKTRPSMNTIVTERITLSLEDIVPADGTIPEINDPSRARIYPTTWFRDDSSEESQDNEEASKEIN